MVKGQLKKKVFVTPEKPGDMEEPYWVENEKGKPKSMAKARKKKIKNILS